jgi:hypothetical protein
MSSKDLCILVLAAISVLQHSVKAETPAKHQKDNKVCTNLNLRYVIFSDDQVKDPVNSRYDRRTLGVILEESAFSEDNLTKLSKCLMSKYSEPNWLFIWVYTNMEQLSPPDAPAISESDKPSDIDKHHWAFMVREEGNEFFRYNLNPPSSDLKTVVVKGKEVYSPQN